MDNPKEILIDDYTYDLPVNRIAKFPLKERDKSKLLVYKHHTIKDALFENLSKHLAPNSLLVFNNTKVIQARIKFRKDTGANIEIFCLSPKELHPSEQADHKGILRSGASFDLCFQQTEKCTWKCIVGNLKKWKEKSLSKTFIYAHKEYTLTAEKLSARGGSAFGGSDNLPSRGYTQAGKSSQIIQFRWNNKKLSFGEVLKAAGTTPIPPYLNREAEISDKERYQTIYSKYEGSVAAPTAGFHFTDKVFKSLKIKNIKTAEFTLHISASTFIPVKTRNIREHQMHTEHIFITTEALKKIIAHIGHIIAVGTTSLRILESIYWLGVKILSNSSVGWKHPTPLNISQWEAYELTNDIAPLTALNAVLSYMKNNKLSLLSASTQIMIVPGYDFKIVKGLITNFHQPKSTLLLLVSAFIGDEWKKVYSYALKNDFRFLSYGDCCLLKLASLNKNFSQNLSRKDAKNAKD